MTTYYVSTVGNNSSNGTSTSTPFKNIQYACSVAVAGDTIKVMPGTYQERIWIGTDQWSRADNSAQANACKNGTAGNPITLEAYDINNKPKITWPFKNAVTDQLFRVQDRSYWTIKGLKFDGFWGAGIILVAQTASVSNLRFEENEIWNQQNELERMGHPQGVFGFFIGVDNLNYSITDCYVLNNWMENISPGVYSSYDECFRVNGNAERILVEGNTIKNGMAIAFNCLGAIGTTTGLWGQPRKIIYRNNTVDGVRNANYGSATGFYADRPHSDIIWEGNTALGCKGSFYFGYEPGWTNGTTYSKRLILRNNYANGRSGISMGAMYAGDTGDQHEDPWLIISDIYASHNTFVSTGDYTVGWGLSKRTHFKNNVVANPGGSDIMLTAMDAVIDGWEADGNVYDRTSGRWEFGQLNYYSTFASYQSGSGQDANGFAGQALLNADKTLKQGSTGFGQIVPLTTTTSAKTNSTSLVVADAGYFTDGYGLIPGDRILIDGTIDRTVTAVNYDTNTITLNSSATWNSGVSVGYYNAASPGKFQSAVGNIEFLNANAGDDKIVVDSDNSGSELVALNASGTTSSTTVTSYSWSAPGITIPDGQQTSATFPVGTHVVTLTVTNATATDTDSVTITVKQITASPCDTSALENSTFGTNNFNGWTTISN